MKLVGTIAGLAVMVLVSGSYGQEAPAYPAADDFDEAGSDPQAIEVAHRTMAAMGGHENWDRTRHITWRFFGRRLHLWDKWTGNLRLEDGDMVVLMNLHTRRGRAWHSDVAISHPDSLASALQRAYELWINDSYWLIMPYKLKDSGVTLRYIGRKETLSGRGADVLQLTFESVGVTPVNKYHVYVDTMSGLVTQWDFFETFQDTEPRFSTPWDNWQSHGAILLSDDRGRNQHTGVAVFDDLPTEVYVDPGVSLPMEE